MTPEHGDFLTVCQDFEVTVADTPEKLEAAYRLRHQVYCVERGYFDEVETALEMDNFDTRSGHALLTLRGTGQVVGTVRVVVGSRRVGQSLPMQRLCMPDAFRPLPLESTGEISRFAISKNLREAGYSGSLPLRIGLMQGILRLSGQMGLTHWCAVMEHSLLRLLRVSAIHFQSLGPAIEHHGLRQPTWGRIDDVLARMRVERPAVWDYVTEGGLLWQPQVRQKQKADLAFA